MMNYYRVWLTLMTIEQRRRSKSERTKKKTEENSDEFWFSTYHLGHRIDWYGRCAGHCRPPFHVCVSVAYRRLNTVRIFTIPIWAILFSVLLITIDKCVCVFFLSSFWIYLSRRSRLGRFMCSHWFRHGVVICCSGRNEMNKNHTLIHRTDMLFIAEF